MDKAPVFVKIEEYKDIMDVLSLMREKTRQAKFLIDKITEIKVQEDQQLSTWAKELDDVERRIESVDRALLEPNI